MEQCEVDEKSNHQVHLRIFWCVDARTRYFLAQFLSEVYIIKIKRKKKEKENYVLVKVKI